MTLPERILAVAEEGLSLWKTFIATREDAYKRSMDKKMRLTIEAGEKYILTDMNKSLDEKKKRKLKEHYQKRFITYNEKKVIFFLDTKV